MGQNNPAWHSQPRVQPHCLTPSQPLTSPWPSPELDLLSDLSTYNRGLQERQRKSSHQGM